MGRDDRDIRVGSWGRWTRCVGAYRERVGDFGQEAWGEMIGVFVLVLGAVGLAVWGRTRINLMHVVVLGALIMATMAAWFSGRPQMPGFAYNARAGVESRLPVTDDVRWWQAQILQASQKLYQQQRDVGLWLALGRASLVLERWPDAHWAATNALTLTREGQATLEQQQAAGLVSALAWNEGNTESMSSQVRALLIQAGLDPDQVDMGNLLSQLKE